AFLLSISRHHSPSRTSTLSLHDALPICTRGSHNASEARGASIQPSRFIRRPKHNAPSPALWWFIRFAREVAVMPLSRSTRALVRSEEHTSELQSRVDLVCRLLLEKKKTR